MVLGLLHLQVCGVGHRLWEADLACCVAVPRYWRYPAVVGRLVGDLSIWNLEVAGWMSVSPFTRDVPSRACCAHTCYPYTTLPFDFCLPLILLFYYFPFSL
jgi:hypothetical protein